MPAFKNQSLQSYLDQLASRHPVPGGGSAAALVGALGVALISMTANYSVGKTKSKPGESRIKRILKESERLRRRLLRLVDLDAQAYLQVVRTRKASAKIKHKAIEKAREVPLETCRACYAAIELTSDLVRYGNPYLLSDVKAAVEMLSAAFHSAMFNVEVNP